VTESGQQTYDDVVRTELISSLWTRESFGPDEGYDKQMSTKKNKMYTVSNANSFMSYSHTLACRRLNISESYISCQDGPSIGSA
jgi:hypothetical protein